MKKVKEVLNKYDLKPVRYSKKGNVTIVGTREGDYVIKKRKENTIYDYLNSRSFRYYPQIVGIQDGYEISEYIEEIDTPNEQKMLDMIDLVSLLHNKTTYFKEVDEDEYKKIYEDVSNNIEYLYSYYQDIITVIESKIYMSPSEYLFARNISKVFSSLNFCKHELEKWYELIKEKRKQRFVVLHNNLDLDHFLKNEKSYLISWDKSRIDIPIFDIYKLYKKYGLDYDFEYILKRYEKSYPLLEEERKLLIILLSLPDKIEFDKNEYENTKVVSKTIDTIYKTENLISIYYSSKEKAK